MRVTFSLSNLRYVLLIASSPLRSPTDRTALQEQGLKKIAIVGGNAKAVVLSGGGSAALKPSFFVTPYDGIVSALGKIDPDVQVTYSEGARGTSAPTNIRSIMLTGCTAIAYMQMPTLENEIVTDDGRPGWIGSFHSHEDDNSMRPVDKPLKTMHIDETRIFLRYAVPLFIHFGRADEARPQHGLSEGADEALHTSPPWAIEAARP